MTDTDETRIIVGVDGSEQSIRALRYAAHLAEALDAPLEAIITWAYMWKREALSPSTWSPKDDAKGTLEEAVAKAFDGNPPARLTQTTLQGMPAHMLIDESKRAQMLVLGSRGRGGFSGLVLGSVSSACAAHAHCPVVIMRGTDE